ncbi:MAG: ATP-binding cassette domain-containing protein [Pseudomonadota bacterium]|nr:ATP-binding cassette domain-containing protein [Pseudomonadota bacterium]
MPGAGRLEVLIAEKAWRGAAGARGVLRDVAFSAAPAERLALFGPSGTGKTTTLRIVLGLDTEFTGRVQRPTGPVGTMFQEPRLLPWMDLRGNLRLVAGPAVTVAEIDAVLEQVGLPGAGKRFPAQLSLGMARRAALARALLVQPRLLVLDEPFASLDPQLASSLAQAVVGACRRLGATLLFATHSVDHALATADRVLVLEGQPATLAADLPIPAPGDRSGRGALSRDLIARFPFLGSSREGGLDELDDEPAERLIPGRAQAD